jgi:hypothetical protein
MTVQRSVQAEDQVRNSQATVHQAIQAEGQVQADMQNLKSVSGVV